MPLAVTILFIIFCSCVLNVLRASVLTVRPTFTFGGFLSSLDSIDSTSALSLLTSAAVFCNPMDNKTSANVVHHPC